MFLALAGAGAATLPSVSQGATTASVTLSAGSLALLVALGGMLAGGVLVRLVRRRRGA